MGSINASNQHMPSHVLFGQIAGSPWCNSIMRLTKLARYTQKSSFFSSWTTILADKMIPLLQDNTTNIN